MFGMMTTGEAHAQSAAEGPFTGTDTIPSESVIFTASSASEYIIDLLETNRLWSPAGDTIKLSLARLIDHYHEPFDSVRTRLSGFDYDSIKLKHIEIARHDTLLLKWLNDSTFIIDTVDLEKEPLIIQKTVIHKVIYTSGFLPESRMPETGPLTDTLLQERDTLLQEKDILPQEKDTLLHKRDTLLVEQDTLTEVSIDSVFLEKKGIQMHQIKKEGIVPPIIPPGSNKSASFFPDSGKIILSDTLRAIVAEGDSPFHIVPGEKMPDSLRYAVETLLSHTFRRDSILLFFHDVKDQKTPFWLTTGEDDLYRYWVKNYRNDSITIWMGNPSKYDITLILEEDLRVKRMEKEEAVDIPITLVKPDTSLAEVKPLEEIPVYWDYDFSSSFALNQTYFSNWSKGGENSLSSLLDIKGKARYTNTEAQTQWTNSGRLNYGTIITEQHGLRTNTDLLELNSKYNKVIRKKIDLSAIFYMKNQIAKGYNYPNDSVVVSKFLNPGTFTVGLGFEYKPFKNTLLNFSPLSYKNTFVLDTANIDQTAHGIESDKRARQEMGGQLLIQNETNILNDLKISNTLRLFSNYLNKPQNIDVDWEINFDQRINWYFSVILNLHIIYDNDVLFPVLDENDQPVLLPDGSKKKVPKMQFKQFLGLSFLFNF